MRLCQLFARADVLDRAEIALPQDRRRHKQLFALREAVPEAINRRIGQAKLDVDAAIEKTAADMIVPFRHVADTLRLFRTAFGDRGLDYAIWGHISDGNLHPNVVPHSLKDVRLGNEAIFECGREIIRLGGCPLAEHGVGRNPVKQALMRQLYSDAGVDATRQSRPRPGGEAVTGRAFSRSVRRRGSHTMNRLFAHWLTTAVALGVSAWVLPGVEVDSLTALLVAALVLGFVNAVVKPLLVLLTLPITVVTLGLFYFVVNGLAFALSAWLAPGFGVRSFGWAMLGALLVGAVSWFIGSFRRTNSWEHRLR